MTTLYGLGIPCMLGMIILLVLVLLLRKARPMFEFDNSVLQQQLQREKEAVIYWQDQSQAWHDIANSALGLGDSLNSLSPKIKAFYENADQTIDIDIGQLDGIVQSN